MTIYQIVPADLHGSFFFKIVQKILKDMQGKDDIKKFKYGLFMLLHVESQANFAHLFNEKQRDLMEELGVGTCPMIPPDQIPFDQSIESLAVRHVSREMKSSISTSAQFYFEGEKIEERTPFEELFVLSAEDIETSHDFLVEIRERREAERIRINKEIEERVANMRAKLA
jgi:hypothetical protein